MVAWKRLAVKLTQRGDKRFRNLFWRTRTYTASQIAHPADDDGPYAHESAYVQFPDATADACAHSRDAIVYDRRFTIGCRRMMHLSRVALVDSSTVPPAVARPVPPLHTHGSNFTPLQIQQRLGGTVLPDLSGRWYLYRTMDDARTRYASAMGG